MRWWRRRSGESSLFARRRYSTGSTERLANGAPFRQALARTAAQAAEFGERYGDRLSAADREFLDEYSKLPEQRLIRRKLALMRLRTLPEHNVAQRLGILWRG